jgi:phage terminase large subunit-like protein
MSLKAELIKYSEDVLNGDIVACEKHKWACLRFLNDLDREGTDEFPYIFNENLAERFLDWMRLFKHRKGVLAGKKIEPHIIQKFVFGNIYGWIHKDTGFRRFNKGYWQVGRKNAKSQSCGAVGSYEGSAFGEPFAEVYMAATKKDQAKIVWEETEAMINGNPDLRDRFKVAYGTITHIKSGSIIKPLSKEDRKTGDGYNPQCGIIDEYHAHETSEMYDIIDSGMGARPQPLLLIITTAGFNLNNPCYQVEYKYVSQILDPNSPVENENYFVMINELDKGDDIKDEKNWEKANPILASYEEGRRYLRGQLKIALDVPEKMKNFLTKNMNIWVDAKDDGYMDMSKWRDCKSDDTDIDGLPIWLGADLSMTTDLTSVGWVAVDEDGEFIVGQHSFMPEERLKEKMATDKVRYDLWVEQGYLTLTPGEMVDYTVVEEWIEKFAEGKHVQEFAYDKWNAMHLAQNLEKKGFTCVEIPQRIAMLSIPTKTFREKVYEKKVRHNGDPVLQWALNNAVIKMDDQENIMISKKLSKNRIDPAAAVINAFARAMYGSNNRINYQEITEDYLKMMGW